MSRDSYVLEKDVRNRTLKRAKSMGVPSIRLYFGGGITVGWPDDIFLIPGGRPFFIEFKATGKKPTTRQIYRIQILKELGYDVEVFDNPDEACQALSLAVGAARLSKNRN